jgi:hypothetical protein
LPFAFTVTLFAYGDRLTTAVWRQNKDSIMETEQRHLYGDNNDNIMESVKLSLMETENKTLWRESNDIFMETEQRHLYGDRTRASLWRHNNDIIMETIKTALWRERNKTLWKQKTKHYGNRKQSIMEREQRHLYGDRTTAYL